MSGRTRPLDFDGLRPPSPFVADRHQAWRREVRAFVEAEIAPHLAAWDAAASFPDALYERAAAAGILGMGFPQALGGTGEGVDLYHRIIFAEEFFRHGSGVVFADLATHWISLPPVLAGGNAQLVEEVARPVLAGTRRIAFAATEPSGGSDVGAIATTAERRGDVYVVNGSKALVSGALRADYVLAAVRTGAAGVKGLSLLLIDVQSPGVSREPSPNLGWYSRSNGSLRFEQVEVPVSRLIGAENGGFAPLAGQFNVERFSGIAATLAMTRSALAEAIAWARERRAFGARLIDHQVLRHKLVHMLERVNAAYACLDVLVWRFERGEQAVAELAMLKVHCTQLLETCSRECLQVLGGRAYTADSRLERIHREGRLFAIGGGTEEVLRDLVARQLAF